MSKANLFVVTLKKSFTGYEVKEVLNAKTNATVKVIEFSFNKYPEAEARSLFAYHHISYFGAIKGVQKGGFRTLYSEEKEAYCSKVFSVAEPTVVKEPEKIYNEESLNSLTKAQLVDIILKNVK